MIVICLEGSHGCGKTTLVREFDRLGFNTLDEVRGRPEAGLALAGPPGIDRGERPAAPFFFWFFFFSFHWFDFKQSF
jgi:hypothetical protein